MSYILEALQKSDAERKRGEVPTLNGATHTTSVGSKRSASYIPWILSGALGAVVIGLAGVLIFRPDLVVLDPPVAASAPTPSPAPTASPTPPEATPAPEPEPEVTQEVVAEAAPKPMPEAIAETMPEQMPDPMAAPESKPEPEPISEPESEQPPLAHAVEPEPEPEPEPESMPASIPEATPPSQKPNVISAATAPQKPQPVLQHSAKILVDSAWSAIDKGFYNQALRDLNQAVDIEPGYADAWFARGWTNEKSGNELSAIGDYGRAITAKPDHAFALFSRGYLNLYIASAQGAVTDFVRTQGVAQDESLRLYSHLWLYLSRTRAGQEAQTRLVEDTASENLDHWPGPLVRRFLGHIEDGRVIAAMDEGNAAARLERRCTGYFFLGISALLDQEPQSARAYFEKALATGAVQFRQYDAAKRELDKLNR